jgi:hypothetical protein
VESNPASGDQDQEYIELKNTGSSAADLSGWRMSGGVQHTLQPGTVIPAGISLFLTPSAVAFRARTTSPKAGESRYVQGNYNGHLSNFSELLTLSDASGNTVATFTTPNTPSDVQRWLRISEFQYNPVSAAPDAEFIEVVNTHTTLVLDLTGVKFTNGFDFSFPVGFSLAPGARSLIVLNAPAFAAAHPGHTATIAGSFAAGRLSNSGETIKLDDATGSTVEEFTYNDRVPWPQQADGGGFSLSRVNLGAAAVDPLNWRATAPSPGTSGTISLAAWMAARGLTNPNDDPDANGLSAAAEYAFGADLTASGLIVPIFSEDATAVTFHRRANSEGVSTFPEISEDLLNWDSSVNISHRITMGAIESITVTLPEGWPRAFARLKMLAP